MSFVFDTNVFLNGEIETLMKDKLNGLLSNNSSNKTKGSNAASMGMSHGKISASDNNVFVKKISFNNKPPIIDILGMSILDSTNAESALEDEKELICSNNNNTANDNKTIKTIVKLVIENFKIELKSDIESNLLLVYGCKNIDPFLLPDFVCNESFNIPINLKFSNCKLETILDLNYEVGSNVKMNFNDVNIAFEFDCSIPLLTSSIKNRLTSNIDFIFKEVLPNAILDMSMKYMNKKTDDKDVELNAKAIAEKHHLLAAQTTSNGVTDDDVLKHKLHIQFDEQDAENASPVTMMKLCSMASKRFSLSLRNFEEDDAVLERSNLTNILSNKTLKLSKLVHSNIGIEPSHDNSDVIYEATKALNVLPMENDLKFTQEFVEQIADLQETLNETSLKRHGKTKKFKRRKIAIGKTEKVVNGNTETVTENISVNNSADVISVESKTTSPSIPQLNDVEEPNNQKEKKTIHSAADKSPNLKGLRVENPLLIKPTLKHSNSLLLTPTRMAHVNSTPATPSGILMKRVMSPLVFTDRSRSPSIPLSEHTESMIKLNWKNSPDESDKTQTKPNKKNESIVVDRTIGEKESTKISTKLAVLDSPYRKLLESTPLKNWLQHPSYLDNFAQSNSHSASSDVNQTKINDYHIHNSSNKGDKEISNMLQELHVAPPPYSN